jgi:hypothetical protein
MRSAICVHIRDNPKKRMKSIPNMPTSFGLDMSDMNVKYRLKYLKTHHYEVYRRGVYTISTTEASICCNFIPTG